MTKPHVLRHPLWRGVSAAPVVIHLHAPKTGGTTLHFNVEAAQSAKGLAYTRLRIDRNRWTPPTLMVPNWTGAWVWPDALGDALEHLNDRPMTEPIFISGHFPYGIHKKLKHYLPNRPHVYIGQVRDPIARELSSLNYEAAKSKDGIAPDAYLKRLKSIPPGLMDNPQTRLWAGVWAMGASMLDMNQVLNKALSHVTRAFIWLPRPSKHTN